MIVSRQANAYTRLNLNRVGGLGGTDPNEQQIVFRLVFKADSSV